LLANNPDKVKPVRYYGIAVSPTVPLELPVQEFDEDYMRTKKERFGH
ncbi:bifunctional 3,4-dihydroxy-2-butanone-4-phosphate synthase/GTP cyclohydrolase II, partial [Candidatus Bathyarchaeota archaeon]|nr:bifunctional 3,4-dihydroxy-2-butanone-4-phosphate synthase/GTP cyclohydrolase II [Candidatus Bathyarchaeota archaeon]